MFDKGKVERNEEKFFTLHEATNNQLKASTLFYNNGDNYYREYEDFVRNLSRNFEGLKSYTTQNLTALKEKQEKARTQAETDRVFAESAEEQIRIKTEELSTLTRNFDESKASYDRELTALEPKKMAKLKVKDQTKLQDFFGAIHRVFYSDAAEPFDWAKFKTAFEKDKMKDFQARLGNPRYAQITEQQIEQLSALKDDAFYADLAKNPKEGSSILPILNYLRHFVDAARGQQRIAVLQREITDIKTNAPSRGENAKIQAQVAEGLRKNVAYLEELNNRLVRSAEPFGDESNRVHRAAEEYNQHKDQLRNTLAQFADNAQHLPRELYASS